VPGWLVVTMCEVGLNVLTTVFLWYANLLIGGYLV
jgi:hypothetical protein